MNAWWGGGLAAAIALAGLTAARPQADPPVPPAFADDAARHEWILNTLTPWMEQYRGQYHNVPRSDGQFLRTLVAAVRPRRALEIGTANGYSALWLGLGLEAAGGRLTTVEIEPDLVREARGHLQRAGLDRVVTCIEGDAFEVVPELRESYDFCFLDIGRQPLPFFRAVEPKLAERAVVAVHRPPGEGSARDYLDFIRARPGWITTVVQTGQPTGIIVSVRQRKE